MAFFIDGKAPGADLETTYLGSIVHPIGKDRLIVKRTGETVDLYWLDRDPIDYPDRPSRPAVLSAELRDVLATAAATRKIINAPAHPETLAMLLQAVPECSWLNPVAADLFAALCNHLRTCPSHVYTELELGLLDMVETAVAFGRLAGRVQTEDDATQSAYAAYAAAAAQARETAKADPDSMRLRERYGKGAGVLGPIAATEDQPKYRAKRRRPRGSGGHGTA